MADALSKRISGTSFGLTITSSASNVSLNGAGIAHAWIVAAETADPITHVWFRYGSRTGTPPSYSIRIELLDTAGAPNNTDAGGGSPTAAVITPPADATWDGTGRWIQLTNPWTPTIGQVFCITIRYSSGTVDASNFSAFTARISGVNGNNRNFPYTASLSAGTWTNNVQGWLCGWKTASGVFGVPTTGSISSSLIASGHRLACAVTIPAATGTSFKVHSFEVLADVGAAGSTVKFGIWDGSGVEIASVTLDTDWFSSLANRATFVTLTTQPTLLCGTEYFYGLEANGAGTVELISLQLGSADDRDAFPEGLNKSVATWNGVTWTKDTTIMPLIEIVASDVTVPSGGGAGPIVIGNGGAVIRGLTI